MVNGSGRGGLFWLAIKTYGSTLSSWHCARIERHAMPAIKLTKQRGAGENMNYKQPSTSALRRMKQELLSVVKTGLLVGLIVMPVQLLAYSSNPPLAKTGAPGETTCRDCHNAPGTGNLNAILPGLTYTPGGAAVTWTINSAAGSGGFELSVRSPANAQAGTLGAGTASSIRVLSSIQYASHTARATSWSITWTPPATNLGNLTVYLTGVDSSSNAYAITYTLCLLYTSPSPRD